MRNRIIAKQNAGEYTEKIKLKGVNAYQSVKGWVDYYISDNVVFSHRTNAYQTGVFGERLHFHDFYELTIIISCDGVEFISDEQRVKVFKGTSILAKPNKFHMFRIYKPTVYDRFVVYFKNIDDIFPYKSIMDFTKKGNESCAIFIKDLDETIFKIESALTNESTYQTTKAFLSLCNLFLCLSDSKNEEKKQMDISIPPFIHKIKEYVDKNFSTIRSVENLSKQFFYSREYVSRAFKKYYNTPLYYYILKRKITLCASLLSNGESVEVASKKAGFINASSFINSFKNHYGVTPSEYKKIKTDK